MSYSDDEDEKLVINIDKGIIAGKCKAKNFGRQLEKLEEVLNGI